MKEWLDINPGSWYYNEVLEATNYELADGELFIQGILYNGFEPGSKRFFKEITASKGQKEFNLGESITVTSANPLYVYVDGTQIIYEGVKIAGGSLGNTGNIVVLFTGVQSGQIVAFVQGGIPSLNPGVGGLMGRPVVVGNPMYPSKPMDQGGHYYYSTEYMPYKEYCYAYGMALRRLTIPLQEWARVDTAAKYQQLLQEYIGFKRDVYTITPNDVSWFPYAVQLAELAKDYGPGFQDGVVRSWIVLPYNLEGVTCRIEYVSKGDGPSGQFHITKGNFKVDSPSGAILYNDRVFPQTHVTEAEVLVLINRLRKSFIARFTDLEPESRLYHAYDGSIRATKVNEYRRIQLTGNSTLVPLSGPMLSNGMEVYIDGKKQSVTDFDIVNESTVRVYPRCGKKDIVVRVAGYREESTRHEGINGWYKWDIIELENELLMNGERMVNISIDPNNPMKRYETVVVLNRFRRWCVERFKL